ncbi:hypothetical protein BHE74_00017088 [Ensete ventricosum]|nr:hypothetical protein GW17_00040904 [Ensete ventricosum]RWW74911.1 hypothetical protein BHE74_00017088 [Ensete ventricosum]
MEVQFCKLFCGTEEKSDHRLRCFTEPVEVEMEIEITPSLKETEGMRGGRGILWELGGDLDPELAFLKNGGEEKEEI